MLIIAHGNGKLISCSHLVIVHDVVGELPGAPGPDHHLPGVGEVGALAAPDAGGVVSWNQNNMLNTKMVIDLPMQLTTWPLDFSSSISLLDRRVPRLMEPPAL